MKRPNLIFLFGALALASCQTAHDAAVSTFRVVDAPHQYIRRKLGLDEEGQTTTTTTTTETYSDTTPYPPQQPYTTAAPPPPSYYGNQPPPPPVQTEHRVTTSAPEPPPKPTAPPRVVHTERQSVTPKPTPTPHTVSSSTNLSLPYAKPVPGKPGYVFSPYDPNGGYVDVKGYSPGQKVKDPYSGKIFLVP